MGVGSENVCPVLREREGFADELHRSRGVGGENHRVFWRGAEERKHTFASLLRAVSAQLRAVPDQPHVEIGEVVEFPLPLVCRVGVPEDVFLKERRMHTDEGLGIKGPSHIIDINFSRLFQAREVALPQRVQEPCKFVFGVLSQERFVGGYGVALDEVSGNETFVEKRGRERDRIVFPLNRVSLFRVVDDSFL